MKITLTDSEWISLIDGDSEDSQLPRCCANISALRDELIHIIREGRNEDIMDYRIQWLKDKLTWVADGHDLTPLLKKVCDQIGFDPAANTDHVKQPIEKA